MPTHIHTQTISMPQGHPPITLETGRLARQADGAVFLKQGRCAMLATVCANKEPREGQSFFPLSVDYVEKFASAGRIPGSFHRREGKLSDYEVLISRLTDRALRPLFPEDYLCDVQVVITLLSSDPDILPDALVALAASAALAVSDIPIQEPISEVRVSRVDGQFVINPTRTELARADMDFIVAGSAKNLMMVEGEAKECLEADLVQALHAAHEVIKMQIEAQNELHKKVGAPAKRDYPKPVENEELRARVKELTAEKIRTIARTPSEKKERSAKWDALKKELAEQLGEEIMEAEKAHVHKYFDDLQWEIVRDVILDEHKRLDGRPLDEVRPLSMEVDFLPSPHGAALFTRGETQSVTSVTLGTSLSDLLLESAHQSVYSKFILHYNFPPFSTGEVKPMRGPGRREVGHGNLAMRSLKQMLPPEIENPYTIRVVSDILESNGSSSMATVCAGSLALMDAGVQVKKHVGGIAMGLISRAGDHKYAILSDILGDEDHLGDMDFKVTGTRDGICGVQMDIKVDGLSAQVLSEALEQARRGRLHILDAMYNTIEKPRETPKPHAPRIEKIIIDKEFIGAIIGPQGKVVQDIQKRSESTVTIEEKDGHGEITVFSTKGEGLALALEMIKALTTVPTAGEVYEGEVKSIQPYGAFVEFLPKVQGLLHISQVAHERLETLEGVLKEGDIIQVKLLETDSRTGKYKLSRKVLLPRP